MLMVADIMSEPPTAHYCFISQMRDANAPQAAKFHSFDGEFPTPWRQCLWPRAKIPDFTGKEPSQAGQGRRFRAIKASPVALT
jgi:hypothetical protein